MSRRAVWRLCNARAAPRCSLQCLCRLTWRWWECHPTYFVWFWDSDGGWGACGCLQTVPLGGGILERIKKTCSCSTELLEQLCCGCIWLDRHFELNPHEFVSAVPSQRCYLSEKLSLRLKCLLWKFCGNLSPGLHFSVAEKIALVTETSRFWMSPSARGPHNGGRTRP